MNELSLPQWTGPYSLTSTTPANDPGNATLVLDGWKGAALLCTAASSGTGTVEAQHDPLSNTWTEIECYQFASGTYTYRAPGATITLAANGLLFIPAEEYHAVRFNLGGTSATVYLRTFDGFADRLLLRMLSNGIALTGNVSVQGIEAHDAASTANPILQGLYAVDHGANPTAVAAGDLTRWIANRAGVPFVIGGHPNIITTEFTIADADGAQTNAALITVSSGTKIVVTRILVTCDGDNTVNVACRIGFAAATLASAATSGAAGIVASHPDIQPGQGFATGSGAGILGIGADGEDLRLTCDDPVTGSIVITVSYYTVPA